MGLKNWYESDKSGASPSALSVESQTTARQMRLASGMSDLVLTLAAFSKDKNNPQG